MKNILTLLLISISALVRSATLYVEENGASGAYTTIAAAVAASSAGDRILVFPRSGGAAYSGFTYAGGSLQILSAVEGERYLVNSDITFGALTGNVHISNLKTTVAFSIISTTAFAASQKVRFTDSYFTGAAFNFLNDYNYLYLQADTLIGGTVRLAHGGITGSYLENVTEFYNTTSAFTWGSYAPIGDTLFFVGNHFNAPLQPPFYSPFTLYGNTSSYYFENNYFVLNSSAYYGIYLYTSLGGNVFNNNTIVQLNPGTAYTLNAPLYAGMQCNNNAFITTGYYAYSFYFSGAGKYNFTNSTQPYTIFPTDATNITGAALTYDANTGAITSAVGIDDGNPGAEFTDIDLTRNDVGCFGGSFSRANFDNADNGSRVLLVNTPRRVIKGASFTITGDGLDK